MIRTAPAATRSPGGGSRHRRSLGFVALSLALVAAQTARAQEERRSDEAPRYRVQYEAQILPAQGTATVRIRVEQSDSLLREISFPIDSERVFDVAAEEGLEANPERITWFVPDRGGELRYTVRIDHLRDPARYDARCTSRWALFRGEDLFPSARTRRLREAVGRFRFRLRVPPDWEIVSAYESARDGSLRIRERGRAFDQPEGWFLAGKLRSVREDIAGMAVTVASPGGDPFRERDALALLRWVAPELRAIVPSLPERLLLVGADDPMWRGGLSGPRSIYLHTDRPLIDKDTSSPLLHELMHVVTRARGQGDADWIVEGLAEYYSLELLRRSGTISATHYADAIESFRERGAEAETLRAPQASGAITARAVGVFHDLDAEIRARSEGRRDLDDVVAALREDPEIATPERLRALADDLAGSSLERFWRRAAPSILE